MPDLPSPRERNLLEAFLHGASMIGLLVAATVGAVFVLMIACGAPPGWGAAGGVAALLLGSLVLRFYARLAANP